MRWLRLVVVVVVVAAAAAAAAHAAHADDLPPGHHLSEDGETVCSFADAPVQCYPRVVPRTHHWSPVRPGQVVSADAALRVRVNLETRAREARYVNGDDDSVADGNDSDGTAIAPSPEADEREDDGAGDWQPQPLTSERRQELEDLWEEMVRLANLETDTLRRAIEVVGRDGAHADELVQALSVMEDIVHHIDFGADMVTLGGIPSLVRHLAHDDPAVRRRVAVVLGSALQSNPNVQRAALASPHDLLPRLLGRLGAEDDTGALGGQLHALGSLLRGNERAIEAFLAADGAAHVAAVLARLDVAAAATTAVRRKAITLLTDLRTLSEAGRDLQLRADAWCGHFGQMLASGHLDSIEKAAHGLDTFGVVCPDLRASVTAATDAVQQHLASVEDGDEAFERVRELLARL